MALHWELGKIADYKTTCYYTADYSDPMRGIKPGDRCLSGVTETLIWHTIAIGLGEISKANHEEFFARVALYEKLFGALRTTAEGDVPITLADVRQHIGLSTNVSRETQAAWLKRMMDRHARETVIAQKRDLERAEVQARETEAAQ